MDVGVGSVMFSAGLTQRKIRDLVLLPQDINRSLNDSEYSKKLPKYFAI